MKVTTLRQYQFRISINDLDYVLAAIASDNPFKPPPGHISLHFSSYNITLDSSNNYNIRILLNPQDESYSHDVPQLNSILTIVLGLKYTSQEVLDIKNLSSTETHRLIRFIKCNTKIISTFYDDRGHLIIEPEDIAIAMQVTNNYTTLLSGIPIAGLITPPSL